jgi:Uma2 family endonuclease
MSAIALHLPKTWQLTGEQFFQLYQENKNLQLERNARGEPIVMLAIGGQNSKMRVNIAAQLWFWNQKYKLGEVFDISAGFQLANTAERYPDVAWIDNAKWQSLVPSQQDNILPFAPDFVVELYSPSNSWFSLQAKMEEYIQNGTQLGWLINPKERQVEIYRQQPEFQNRPAKKILTNPTHLSGETLLPGFELDLLTVW